MPSPADLDRFLGLIWRPGDVREVRLPMGGRTDSGYFDDPSALAAAVQRVDGRENVYLTINPVNPALLARSANRISQRARSTTSDADVVSRRWLPVDIDPVRPSGISASEGERLAALGVARSVWAYLRGLGWPEPITAMSGNGYWLLYPVELDNDAPSKELVEGVLRHLSRRFSTPAVSIDTTVANAARIAPLIGTLKVKGDATPERPHRRSAIVRSPEGLDPADASLLAAIAEPSAATAPARRPAPGTITIGGDRMPEGWVRRLLEEAGVRYREGIRGGRRWFLLDSCPFHPDDDRGGDCGVGEDADGKGLGHCFHNRGSGRGWQDFRDALGLRRPEDRQAAPSAPPAQSAGSHEGIDAADLLALDIAPLRWVVPDLIPEGTTILAAPPKVGKSCLVYQIAVEASIGGELLGRRVAPGPVLYLALEDGQRRGADRLRNALAGRTMPRGRLEVRWSASPIGQGLEEEIDAWLSGHPDAVLVAIDTLGKVRGRGDGRRNAYEVDVEALAGLQNLFRNRPVGLLIVHHARKEANDDFLASVSGTYGITGSADTIVVVRRKRLERFGTILTTGRDIADQEIAVQFDGGLWGDAAGSVTAGTTDRQLVYQVVEDHGPIYAKAIAERLGREGDGARVSVQNMVAAMVSDGALARVSGGYVVARVRIATGGQGYSGYSGGSDEEQKAPYVPHSYRYSPSSESNGGEIPARAARRGSDVSVECDDYLAHQFTHQLRDGVYVCPSCRRVEEEKGS